MPYKMIGALLKKAREQMLQLHGRLRLLVQRHCMKQWYQRTTPGWSINELAELSEFLFHLEDEKPDEIRAQLNYHYIWRLEEGLNKGTPKRDNLVTHCYILGFVVTLELLSIEQSEAFSPEEARGLAITMFEEMKQMGVLSPQEMMAWSPRIDALRMQLQQQQSAVLERIKVKQPKVPSWADHLQALWEQTVEEQSESLWAGLSKFSPSLLTVRTQTPPVAFLLGDSMQTERVGDEMRISVRSGELYHLAVEVSEAKYAVVLQMDSATLEAEKEAVIELLYPQHPGHWALFPVGLSKLFQMKLHDVGSTRLFVVFFSQRAGEQLQAELPVPSASSCWSQEERAEFLTLLQQKETSPDVFSFQVNVQDEKVSEPS